jgi:hypothetical protein
MNRDTVQLGLLLEPAQTHQRLVEALIEKLKAHTAGHEAVMREQIRRSFSEELAAVQTESARAVSALQAVQRAASARTTFWMLGLAAMTAAIAIGIGWWVLPNPSEIATLLEERDELQRPIDVLVSRGARADLKTCDAGRAQHLCVRVEPRLGRYGNEKDYFVIKGY